MKKTRQSNKHGTGRRVYSTEVGRTCPGCLRAVAECVCKSPHATLTGSNSSASGGDGIVRLHRETKGRKGKGVTLVKGLPLADDELAALAKVLKARCGVGGSVKDGVVELQSADREKIKELLEEQGHQVKLAGG